MLALLEQKIQTRIGNANPVIYGLANSTYVNSVFHDITTGNNASPCYPGTTNCPSGGSIGYNAGVGYDLASGWGSVDAYNFVSDWLLVKPAGSTAVSGANTSATTLTSSAVSVTAGATITFTATVASATTGVTTVPTGTVQFVVDGTATGSAVTLANGTATYALATTALASGPHTVVAAYSGDGNYVGSKASETIDITSATAGDFSLTPATGSVTVASGHNAPGLTYTVTSLNGFSGPVTFNATSASSNLNATFAFSVDPVNVTTTAAGTTVLQLYAYESDAISGTAPLVKHSLRGANALPAGVTPWQVAGSGVALAGLLCLFVPGRRKRLTGLLVAVLSIGILGVSGCGDNSFVNSNVNTTSGTYTITVTATGTNATGATVSHNSTVTFVVQ